MRRKNRKKLYTFIITFLVMDLIVTFTLFNVSNARYESNAVSETELDVALFALAENDDYYITLNKMVPREDPYVYRFSISNTDPNGTLTDVKMQYDLKIITTTNLPLEYELYKNQNYLSSSAINRINEDIIAEDADGTFFRTLTTDREVFGYNAVATNNYTLLVYFSEDNTDSIYQDLIESIQINIDAKQLVDGE